jgi:hypothetical protein
MRSAGLGQSKDLRRVRNDQTPKGNGGAAAGGQGRRARSDFETGEENQTTGGEVHCMWQTGNDGVQDLRLKNVQAGSGGVGQGQDEGDAENKTRRTQW